MPDMVRIAITPGEPAGIGPELVLKLAQHTLKFEIIAIANVKMLQQQAEQLGLDVQIQTTLADIEANESPAPGRRRQYR